ncbi:MAG: chemotaxis protein CheW [Solirubrobacterales bacterium]
MAQITAEIQTVVFRLGSEEYAIDIGKVQEIIRMPEITALPQTPDYVLGVVNLRGNIIPVVDLKIRFSGKHTEANIETRVIVVEVGQNKVGIIVDAVSEVIKLPADQIVPAESIHTSVHEEYVLGVARLDQRLLIVLDVDKLLAV